MKKLLLAFAAGVCLSACATHDPKISIVPYPNHLEPGHGTFAVKGEGVVCDSRADERTQRAVAEFAAQLAKTSGGENPVTVADELPASGIRFVLDQTLPEEGYRLDVTPKGVEVRASRFPGFFYAVQSLRQMLPAAVYGTEPAPGEEWVLPCVSIEDAPRFAYRGMHLDVARHFFSVEEVKRYLDVMAIHKLNRFHWHLTDDQGWRIEIKKYPELTTVGSIRKKTMIRKEWDNYDNTPYGGYYTQDEIRDIVAYAADRAITVIPEIDLPGHMLSALTAYPELGCTGGPYEVWGRWGVADDVLCPGQEKTFEFLEDVLDEVVGLFPSELIHIGGDECPKVRWEKCPRCQARIRQLGLRDKDGYTAEHYLQGYVTDRIGKYLAERGRRIIGWDEILEGQAPSDAIVMSWRGSAGGIKAAKLGHDVIMTPNSHFYFDYYQSPDADAEPFGIGGCVTIDKVYSFDPMADLTPGQQAHILGVQANLWTEYIASDDHLEYMLLPRLAALSEVQWCQPGVKDWVRFRDGFRMDRIYSQMGYVFAKHIFGIKGSYAVDPQKGAVVMTLTTQGDVPIHYTLDGSEPDETSVLYAGPVVVDRSLTLKARGFKPGAAPSRTLTLQAEKAVFRKGLPGAGAAMRPGVAYACYEGVFSHVDEIRRGKLVASGTMPEPSIADAPQEDHFGYIFNGWIRIPERGVWEFMTKSDDGSVLVIGDRKVVDNDGSHASVMATGRVALEAGLHPYTLMYFEDYEGQDLSWGWRAPGAAGFEQIPAERLYVEFPDCPADFK